MIRLIPILLILLFCFPAWAYDPPKGIPDPAASFSTFGEIDQATPEWPAEWTTPSSAVAGHFYIDNTNGSCSDASNGHPDTPRCTIPEGELQAGDFVYIHAGTYAGADSAGDRFDWHGAGTASNPIWITGNPSTKPIFTDKIHIALAGSASYMVIENLSLTSGAYLTINPYNDAYDADHIIVRGCTLVGSGGGGDSGISIGQVSGTDSYPNATTTYVVIYNNSVSAFGDDADPGTDGCGIYQGYHTNYTWVLNNTLFDNGADGIAGSHYSDPVSKTANNYFIGGNTIYSNGENCIDIKSTHDVIISENDCTGPCAREQGAGIVLHYGASHESECTGSGAPWACCTGEGTGTSCSFPVDNAWVIFNKVYNVATGVAMGSSFGCDNCNFIGNLFINTHSDYACDTEALGYNGIQIGGSHGTQRIVDNTFYGYETSGVRIGGLVEGDSVKIHGNIFSRTAAGGYEIIESTTEAYIDMDYNLVYYSGGAASFTWGGESRNLTYMKETASECANCVEGDPLFTSAGIVFTLQSGSHAISANVEGPVGATAYDAFATAWTAFGVTIEKDYAGNARPIGTWDIGAYEYEEGSILYPSATIGSGASMSIGSGAIMTLQ